MCEYCDMTLVNKEHARRDYFTHKPFYLINERTGKRIKADGNNPVMYLREYRPDGDHVWSLVVEFADEHDTVVESPILYCPRCGDALVGKNNG